MRRSLRKPRVNVNFFFFQDIITAALGVILFIALILALNIDTGTESGGTPAASASRVAAEKVLNELLAQLAEKRAALKTILSGGISSDKKALTALVSVLRSEARSWASAVASKSAPVGNKQGSGDIDAALQDRKNNLSAIESETSALDQSLAASQQTTAELEAKLKELEARLLAEEQLKNHIWLIPQSGGTSKEPLLITITSGGCELQRYGKKDEKRIYHGSDLPKLLQDSLAGYSKDEYYVVLYFKPSALFGFSKARNAVKQQGFELGTDVITEDAVLDFSPPEK
ncbi:MAG: hypothetical protein WCH98_09650 [Verrucomicrobiota bacterium]